MDIDITQAKKLVLKYMRKKMPFFLHGTMGIGKSDLIEECSRLLAEEEKLPFNDSLIRQDAFNFYKLIASQIESVDVRGVPFPVDGFTQFLVPSFLPQKGTKGVFFLDEVNLASPSVQSALYQLVLERRLGDYELPEGWTIVAAGNRSEDKANVFPMAAPLKNRFSHANLMVPSEEAWRLWAMDHGIRNSIVAFLAFKPSLLFRFSKDSKDNAFPTPRMWERASVMTDDVTDDDEEFQLIATCVGEAAALEYQGFMKLRKKVNIADILKNPKKVQELNEVGLKYTLISGLADKYKSDNKLMDKILAVVEYMDAEFGVFLLRLMRGIEPKKFVQQLVDAPKWSSLSKEYQKYIL